MHDNISYHLFSGSGCRNCLEALETFVTMYMEIAAALVLLVLIALLLITISESKRNKPRKNIADRLSARRPEQVLPRATNYEHISLSQSSVS
jgi:hypothetical protein